jgi:hypothetical protein
MKRFVQGDNRTQSFLLPEALDDYVTDTNPVRVVDVFVDELDLQTLGFEGAEPALTGRPSYHPEVMLKIYIYGYPLNISFIRPSRLTATLPPIAFSAAWLSQVPPPVRQYRPEESRSAPGRAIPSCT